MKMSEGPDLEKFHVLEQQVVKVKDFEAEGWILDICAGGEGVIGLLKEQQGQTFFLEFEKK